jgi:spore maturation protein CgeB
MEETIRLRSQNPMLRIWDILNEVQKSLNSSIFFNGESEYGAFLAVLEYRANSLYRKEMIEVAKDFGLYLYGDDGWKDLVERKVNFFGSLDNRRELPLLYNASRINLNITQSQTPASPPIRPFDIAACGGSLLSDYRRDLKNLFEIDKEIVCYYNKEDLRGKRLSTTLFIQRNTRRLP